MGGAAQDAAKRCYAIRVVSSRRQLPWIAFASVCIFWGTTAPAIRLAVRYFPPLLLSGTRFALAGGLLLPALMAFGNRPKRWSVVLVRCLPGGLALALTNSLTCVGFQTVESGQGALLLATTALWMSIIDGFWPGSARRASPLAWLGLAIGLGGVALLINARHAAPTAVVGGAVLLLSSLIWASSSVWQSRHPSHLSPLLEAAVQMLIAACATIPIAYSIGERWNSHLPAAAWGAFVFLVMTGSLIGFVSFVYILRQLPPKIVGLYTYVNPVVATWAGWWWLNESIHPLLWPASALVLGSVALVRFAESRQTERRGVADDATLTPLEPSA